MHLAVRVQHHPSRAALLPRLLAALDGLDDVQVINDPRPDGPENSWRTHRACLEEMPAAATSLLVLQDDALPVMGFAEKITAAVEKHPEAVLLAFVQAFPHLTRMMREAQKSRAAFVPFRTGAFVPLVATVYPQAVVRGILEWADSTRGDRFRRPLSGSDDGIIASYCRVRRIQPLALVPSIVDHDDSIPSVSKATRKGAYRRAALI